MQKNRIVAVKTELKVDFEGQSFCVYNYRLLQAMGHVLQFFCLGLCGKKRKKKSTNKQKPKQHHCVQLGTNQFLIFWAIFLAFLFNMESLTLRTIRTWKWLVHLLLPPQYKKHRSSHAHTNNFAKSVVNLVDSVSSLVSLKLLFTNPKSMVHISFPMLSDNVGYFLDEMKTMYSYVPLVKKLLDGGRAL